MHTPPVDRVGRTVALTSSGPPRTLDVAVGLTALAMGAVVEVSHGVATLSRPLAHVMAHPPMGLGRFRSTRLLDRVSSRGRRERRNILADLSGLLDRLVPLLVDALLQRIDLTAVVRKHLDLDDLVTEVDLGGVIARVDVDGIARRLDIAVVLEGLDLTQIVREHVDLDGLVADVDLDAVVARIDVDELIAKVDLAALAQGVISELDVPELIRGSTAAVSSDAVRELRMRGISADDAVGRVAGRLNLRRGARPPPEDAVR